MTRPAYDDPTLDGTGCVTEPLFELEPLTLFSVPAADEAPPAAAVAMPAQPPAAPSTAPTVTFLHTADWQLGMTRHFLAGEAQHTYNAAREDAVVRIGALAAQTGAEFVVVCGDVFDDPRVSTRIIRRTLDALGDYPVPVYLLPGNHDPFDATSVYRSRDFIAACPDNVIVLKEAGVVRIRDGVSLVAAPWTTKRPLSDLVSDQVAQLAASDDIRIVVGHGGVDTLSPNDDPSILDAASLDVAVADRLVDYIALGDRHSAHLGRPVRPCLVLGRARGHRIRPCGDGTRQRASGHPDPGSGGDGRGDASSRGAVGVPYHPRRRQRRCRHHAPARNSLRRRRQVAHRGAVVADRHHRRGRRGGLGRRPRRIR